MNVEPHGRCGTRDQTAARRRHCPRCFQPIALALLVALTGTGAVADPSTTEPRTTAADVLHTVKTRAGTEREQQRRFLESYAFVTHRTTEDRDRANRLRHLETIRLTHDPRRSPEAGSGTRSGYRPRDFAIEDDLLDRFHFVLEGETVIGNRPVWILDFSPVHPQSPARSIKDRFINQTAGRAWIDQAEGALVRIELHLTGPVNVVGGLVGAVQACRVVLERARTPDGLWFNRRLAWRLEGRRLFSTQVLIREETIEALEPVPACGSG